MAERNDKRFWRSIEERASPASFEAEGRDEFPILPSTGPAEPASARFDRRDFLRAAGFAFAGAAAGCQRAPVQKAIPYLVKPEEITPGRAYHYASTCGACPAACGLLVKNRDGRPIKLEGNPDHPASRGGLCAVGQASILGLYDTQRFRGPLKAGKQASWQDVDREIGAELEAIAGRGGAIRLVTSTVHSPTVLASIDTFLSKFENARHVSYDPLSSSAILDAHEQTHGVRVLPRYRFERASVIVGFDADFLGTWISPVEYTAGYRTARNLEREGGRAYHAQFESRLSITGSKADRRHRIAPGETGLILTHLASRIAERAGASFEAGGAAESLVPADDLDRLADRLWSARGQALVVCGEQDVAAQVLCNFINQQLGSYGSTVDVEQPSRQRQGSDRDLAQLLAEIDGGGVDALLIAGVNPVFDLPGGADLAEKIGRIALTVSFAQRPDETSEACRFVCPESHYLEAWGDARPVAGVAALQQPCIEPFGDTRPLIETLSLWSGEGGSAYESLRAVWRRDFFGGEDSDFDAFWNQAVHDGFAVVTDGEPAEARPFAPESVRAVTAAPSIPGGEFGLVLYPKAGMFDGRHAYNAWLQELPDPITKLTWDNYACLSAATAAELDVEDGDVVRLSAAGDGAIALELPVVVQPGQHDRTVAVALGYGATASGRFGDVGPQWFESRTSLGPNGRVGVNAAPWLSLTGGALQYSARTVKVERTGQRHPLGATQTHHTITVPEHLAPHGGERRPAILETTLAEAGVAHADEQAHGAHHGSLWQQDHEYNGRRWGMAIDLDACTGCSACIVACQIENNVPVVGKDEVRRRREMHWIRVDRYYSGDGDDVDVAYQPMLCQHCENAPCETVCPVLATVHSEEGLNQQVYNRCVGTRYCANNCPYKVRRFNWFDYAHDKPIENLVFNPDVAVRTRGVMEKCSFCVQRIQEAKIEAKRLGVDLQDGDIRPACEQSCPAQAIVFGDMNDPASRMAHQRQDPRRYGVLEEINVGPAVHYLKPVRLGEEDESRG